MFAAALKPSQRRLISLVSSIVLVAGLLAFGASSASAANNAHITGTVTDSHGNGIQGIQVMAYHKRFLDGDPDWGYVNEATTDAAGHYNIAGLPSDSYRVWFYDGTDTYAEQTWNNKPDIEQGDDIPVTAPATASGIDAVLISRVHFTGTLTKAGGASAGPDVRVVALQWQEGSAGGSWDEVNRTYTDFDGTYDLLGARGGTYRLEFSDNSDDAYVREYFDNATSLDDATDIVIADEGTATGKDAELSLGGHIKGKVTKNGTSTAIRDIGVEIYSKSAPGDSDPWELVASEATNATGNYDIRGLATGDYHVGFVDYDSAYGTEFYPNKPTVGAGQNVHVEAPDATSGIDAGLVKGAKISGKVTFATTSDEFTAHQVAAYNIATGELAGEADAYGTGNSYSIAGLAPGSYRVEFARASGQSISAAQFYNGKQESAGKAAATPVVLSTGASKTGVNAALAKGGKISGTVVDGEGLPVKACGVFAYTSDGKYATRGDWTDNAGKFSVTGLTGGSYKLVVGGSGQCDGHEHYYTGPSGVLTSDEASAVDIPVSLGGSVTLAHRLVDVGPTTISNTVLPSISGSALVGSVLTANHGSWLSPAGISFDYQWVLDGEKIEGATATTYTPLIGDLGKKLSVMVTASKSGYDEVSATSAETAAVSFNVTTTAKITVDAAGKSKINVACVKACIGYLQVWSDGEGAKKSAVVKYTVAAKSYKAYALTGVPLTATTGAKVRLSQSSPVVGPNPQFNNLEIVRATGNSLKTTAKVTVSAAGKATVNVSCTMACSGYAQIWSDGTDGGPKSSVFHYTLAKAGYQAMALTGVTHVNRSEAKIRLAISSPLAFPGDSPQFNPLQLVAG